jgi:hypothetical protein
MQSLVRISMWIPTLGQPPCHVAGRGRSRPGAAGLAKTRNSQPSRLHNRQKFHAALARRQENDSGGLPSARPTFLRRYFCQGRSGVTSIAANSRKYAEFGQDFHVDSHVGPAAVPRGRAWPVTARCCWACKNSEFSALTLAQSSKIPCRTRSATRK